MQIFQVKFVLFFFFQIVKTKAGKIGNDYILGQVALGHARKIIQRLRVGLVETFAARLVLDNQDALPEKIDIAVFVAKLLDRLFKAGHTFAGNAKDVKKTIPEGFCLGIFGTFVLPFLGKSECACFNFVPA